jgi:membrane associated rhomboid family serine protease
MSRYQLDGRALSVWQFVTYSFLHIGWLHLLLNLAVLYVLGGEINLRLGQVGHVGFYLAGAVVAGLGFVLVAGDDTSMVGASGAVGAVMGAHLVLLPRQRIRLGPRRSLRTMYVIVVFFCYNLIMSLLPRDDAQQVAYEAHIGGMVFGFVVMVLLLALRLLERDGTDLLAILRSLIHRGESLKGS